MGTINNPKIILVIILSLSLISGLLTITWGLPDEMHMYSYNMDEDTNLLIFKNFKPKQIDFDPKYYVSGTLGYYMFAGAVFVGKIMGFYDLVSDPDYYRENVNELRNMYIAQRLLTVILATLLILTTYAIGKEIEDEKMGLLMALFAALLPTTLVNSQYCTHNIILLFFMALSFLFLVRYVNCYNVKDLYWLAFFCGLSLSTKHSGVFTLLFTGYAILFTESK